MKWCEGGFIFLFLVSQEKKEDKKKLIFVYFYDTTVSVKKLIIDPVSDHYTCHSKRAIQIVRDKQVGRDVVPFKREQESGGGSERKKWFCDRLSQSKNRFWNKTIRLYYSMRGDVVISFKYKPTLIAGKYCLRSVTGTSGHWRVKPPTDHLSLHHCQLFPSHPVTGGYYPFWSYCFTLI